MKRYSSSLIGTMLEDENGGWVKYSDHLAAIEQARKEVSDMWLNAVTSVVSVKQAQEISHAILAQRNP